MQKAQRGSSLWDLETNNVSKQEILNKTICGHIILKDLSYCRLKSTYYLFLGGFFLRNFSFFTALSSLLFPVSTFSLAMPLVYEFPKIPLSVILISHQLSVSRFKILRFFPRYLSPSSNSPFFFYFLSPVVGCLFGKSNFPSGNVTLFLSISFYKNSHQIEANLEGENMAPQRSIADLVLGQDFDLGMQVASSTISTYKIRLG